MIERDIKVPVELTPDELAFEFCNMNDEGQAMFFNCIAEITAQWDRPFCFQLQYLIDHPKLLDCGRRVMEQIGEYGKEI